ncbi:TetR/AcrR family transcriptional regulator [Phenylobacterium kunshanense]|uniref:TetR/AcrR family transcriptional regulator n=1 Tax=Phenylobacterium kunshanense TaxID=1445034 RepID=A0A328BMP7_9CAUL|nr:TetR/AcrR family transcriptional regulator [Phenylobacterium kunshanense]RAK67266.1 TetR/AcrR family transcriptional regulator [Phenylobacterium kunshanense]
MARAPGQIDVSKNEAILDAAVEVLAERGVTAPMEDIARRACVSKQTIYNHYGSKADLMRAVTARRVHEITASLEAPDAAEHPAEALADFARGMLGSILTPRSAAFMRMAMLGALEMPEVAAAIYEAGPRSTRRRLAEFLALETGAGRLACPDAQEAAEFFAGMVLGSYQTAALLGVERNLDAPAIERIATEAAARFMRAYAP